VNRTLPTTLVLHALASGVRHGFDIIDVTALASGTVYPILRRLEREALVAAQWEDVRIAQDEQRPPRRYYELTPAGHAALEAALARHRVPPAIASRLRRLRPVRTI